MNTRITGDNINEAEEYLEKLKKLPPLDENTEKILRALANAILDKTLTNLSCNK